MSQSAELVIIILEGIGVDSADVDSLISGVAREPAEIIHHVPRNVERDFRRQAGEAVDCGGVVDLLLHAARGPGVNRKP